MLVSDTLEWKALKTHYEMECKEQNISALFSDPERFEKLSLSMDQLTIDFSKQCITQKTLHLLLQLAKKKKLTQKIQSLFSGEAVNSTEKRPALHTALRGNPLKQSLCLKGKNISMLVNEQLKILSQMVEQLTSGHWRGYSGKAITDVVNIGVGGSDLGPLLVCEALDEYKISPKHLIKIHFASTMDGSQMASLFKRLNPESTLFIIVSKSFGTMDTLANAASAKGWLNSFCPNETLIKQQHFIAISSNEKRMDEWGIAKNNRLHLWNWVGGRFSLWSSVGLIIALKIGTQGFFSLLDGAKALDHHFLHAPLHKNLPVLLGLISIWNTNFLNIQTHAILPYDARLKYFPDYLSQLEMESNGKSVTLTGESLPYHSSPILWGEVGPNAQHAFYQLLHQGTRKVVCDFIVPIQRYFHHKDQQTLLKNQHQLTLAHCFAQSRALMLGTNGYQKVESYQYYSGNQPSTTLLIPELTPYSLGQLIALYEHKVYVMAKIWDINPFDQWGVELGKKMASDTLQALQSKQNVNQFDASTNGLINRIRHFL
jgi:glucose-6-phosphate isomerase